CHYRASIRHMHPTSVEGVDDMIKLGDLTEAGVLRNLLVRHKQGIIYTYIGSVLVAVNPYQLLPIYTAEQVRLYHGRKLGELPPHVFAIADKCYYNLLRNQRNQCCVISGESGAGKTESTKLILQFLAAVSGQHSWIEQQILQANPVLEAFGNAKTTRNDNSSRFGKYVEIFFNKDGIIEGAHIEQYLLEKSRVCHQAPMERNYHIFYCLLSGMAKEQKNILALGDATQFNYLTEGDCITCDGQDDADEFGRIRTALKVLTFTDRESWEIFCLLAAILHLGNISFEAGVENNMESCDVMSSDHFTIAAKLLEKAVLYLFFLFVCLKLMFDLILILNGVLCFTSLQAIYSRLFMWIFGKINSAIHKHTAENTYKSIGLLDIFGFENFDKNSFEQMCINYANEQLQQFFVEHIFKLEQEEYLKEGIKWKNINFTDNQLTIDLLAVKPLNILSLIDEESHFPKGTDKTLLDKIKENHKRSKIMVPSRNIHSMQFGIKHFAGVVFYDCSGFLEKNRDALSLDIISLIQKSSSKLLRLIFQSELNQGNDRRQISTLSGQFRHSLDSLMKALSLCEPFFIRCFKPNDSKQSNEFDRKLCIQQLRYSGLLETIKIRKLGYPIRHRFTEFLGRYRVLLKTTDCDPNTVRKNTTFIKKKSAALTLQKHWRGHRDRKQIEKLLQGFLRLQATVHGRQDVLQFQRTRGAVVTLQSQTRGFLSRKELKCKQAAVIVLQSHTRGLLARKQAVLSAQEKEAQELADLERQRRLEEVLSQSQEEDTKTTKSEASDEEIEGIFGFLPKVVGGQEGPAPEGFEDLEGELVELKEEDDEEDEFSFSKFSALHFQGSATHTHIDRRLQQPLIHHEDEGDTLACVTVWWIILRFMGDIPEPKQARLSVVADTIQKNLVSVLIFYCLQLTVEPPELDFREEDDVMIGEGPTFDRPMTPLEKLHTIVGYAIVKPDIRDEIYCQICKQLTKNPNPKSCSRGWVLLSICLGIFPPTELFTKYLENFIRRGRSEYSANCAERLQRTLRNGERNEPPCWIELRAVEKNEHMVVVVTLMDGQTLSLPVDSACTSAELCQSIAQKTNLKDTFGFSLYIALYEKIWSLGCGGEHILDAISQCEQEERRQGREEQHSPWRLYFRKELFTPWHDCTTDPFSTELIYRQLIHGLKNGDYQSDKVGLNLKQFGLCVSPLFLQTLLPRFPNEMQNFILMISDGLKNIYFGSELPIVEMALTVLFSPPLPEDQFVVAVNWSGVSFQAGKDRTFLQLSYPELTGVQILRTGEVVCMSTLRGEYKLKAVKAHSMVELITIFLEGLKERSVYAVTMQDITRQDDATYLSCKKGDLLCIINDGEYSKDGGWIKGQNERTGQSGAVSADAIMILPTLSRPSDEILVTVQFCSFWWCCVVLLPHREANRDAGKHGKGGKEKLWAKAKEPLKHPLLKSLQKNSELSQLACLFFLNVPPPILKYMGDYPIKNLRTPIELTDQIYGPALEHPELRDEVYCQIMKQMTSNNNGISLERGWQLLWLCCGLFPPSQGLLKHAQKFLNSRSREPLSAACLQRMQGMLSIEARKFPPHQVEVDAIQQNSSQIFHKVHFPNDTREIFEVTTTTRIRDLCRNIANYHSLSSADGYSLFVKTANKVVGMNEQQYFFDNLKQYTDAPKKGKKSKEGTSAVLPYLVLFMRKLWFNVMPGKDITADLVFHFPQELPKYLRGYHTVSKEEMVNLAGLLFRVKVDTDRSQFVMIPKMLKDLVPADQLKIMSSDDWKKHIINAYNKQAGITVDEAKVSFLRTISVWPTFGCAFFEVKQTSERSYPSIIQIAISKQGLTLSDPKNKEVLVMYPFSKITNWSSGNTYFHMTIGSLVKGNTLLCETSLVRIIHYTEPHTLKYYKYQY
uniref:Myosin VIIBb n=1 Tax=Astyanax mexicanus TaxID=7994 RepID=A0A8B9JD85_ASTMX